MHVPLFKHGIESHSFVSSSHEDPVLKAKTKLTRLVKLEKIKVCFSIVQGSDRQQRWATGKLSPSPKFFSKNSTSYHFVPLNNIS